MSGQRIKLQGITTSSQPCFLTLMGDSLASSILVRFGLTLDSAFITSVGHGGPGTFPQHHAGVLPRVARPAGGL